MNDTRPVDINLSSFGWPASAIASIIHRITGVILFAGVGFMLYALEQSLSGPEGFAAMQAVTLSPLAKFIMWGLLTALAYHFIAGIKHLLLDWDIFDTKEAGKTVAYVVVALAAAAAIVLGAWIW